MTTRYTKEHEYIRMDGDTGVVGITDYAQGQLGDVVFVELPEVGRMVAKGEDGRYRSGTGLAVLGASFDNNVRQLSVPTLRKLADELGTTVSLLVAEGDQRVAIAVIVPTNVFYQLSFHEGSRYPLERGAAGIVLLASMPPRPGERAGACPRHATP